MQPLPVVAQAAICSAGNELAAIEQSISSQQTTLTTLSNEVIQQRSFTESHKLSNTRFGVIANNRLLLSRKWAPASQLALQVAQPICQQYLTTTKSRANCLLIVGSSRGNQSIFHWAKRRSFARLQASNSMHGEIASAISITHGITAPWYVQASGCAASLDALELAGIMLANSRYQHALVIGVEIPVNPIVTDIYHRTGVLNTSSNYDPYHKEAKGFHLGDAAAAMLLSKPCSHTISSQQLHFLHAWSNSEATSPIGIADPQPLANCIQQAYRELTAHNYRIRGIVPHASGTKNLSEMEQRALNIALPTSTEKLSLHLIKPFIGHAIGASGLVEAAISNHFINQQHRLPPNLANLHHSCHNLTLTPSQLPSWQAGDAYLKIAIGMGGRNVVVAFGVPPQ